MPDAPSDAQFVELCHRRLLGRDADPAGAAHALAALARGGSRRALIQTLAATEEFAARQEHALLTPAGDAWPMGHFYSPTLDLDLVRSRYDAIAGVERRALPGIDVHESRQHALLTSFAPLQAAMPFAWDQDERCRYYGNNPYFPGADAIVLYSLLRTLAPRRLVEIGSGFSSAVMLDTNERFLDHGLDLTFVEPYPERLRSLLRDEGRTRYRILEQPALDLPLELFTALEANDIVFVDGTHVAKFGSDVVWLLGEVLPRLRPGVVVHFHDIFWPFEYPQAWLLDGRAWNEAYVLRALLTGSRDWSILLFVDWLRRFAADAIARTVPLLQAYPGASLWLVREDR